MSRIASNFAGILAGLALASTTSAIAQEAALRPDQTAFRALYKELVETNTTLSAGSCTIAADRMAARLKAAGYTDSDITLFATPDKPKEGGLVVILPGTSKSVKPMLLLAHIDVVEAKREDWTRDPFTLVEEGGYFYARGAADDKSQAAIWTDMMIRFKTDGYKPARTIKLALTCGEETTTAFNGAGWLAKNKADLISAEFALNEGGGGRTDGPIIDGKGGTVIIQTIQVGEKTVQNYRLETTNPGGHSSQPVPDNAIYELAAALTKVSQYEFPVMLSDTTRTFFAKVGPTRKDAIGAAMTAIAANPNDAAADAVLSKDKTFHSMLRTTCVATLLTGGHANNALPQRATANINCRMFPGQTSEQTQAALAAAINDPHVTITPDHTDRPVAIPPKLDPKIMAPAEKLLTKYYPGVPFVPTMSTGATDAIYLGGIGIPTYGVPGTYGDPDGNGAHGLNERMSVAALYKGRDFLTDYVKALAGGK